MHPEGIKFCGECGAKLERLCPNCNSSNPPNFKFCGECGHKLDLPVETPLKDLSFDEKLDKIQRYLPKGLTEKILAQRDRIEGERKYVTVMFCDMEGFTQFTEKLGSEEAYGIMDQVYEILIHKVHDYEGTVNEMTGDGIMALFGAPIALEDAPQRAIRAALAVHREMAKFSDKLKREQKGIPPLKMRIGIHTGPVVVGTLGNNLRVEFKAVGDTVNLASRMEGLAEPGATYVTGDTFKLTEGYFRFEALGEKGIKGKEEPIQVYRAIASSTSRTRFDVSAERGLTPFVGRERELELLLDGLERAKGGRGQAFSIVSEAGIGKSRLLYEFRKAVSSADVTFLEAKCLSYSRGVAYHLLIDSLKANFDIREVDGDPQITEKVKKGLQKMDVDESLTLPYFLELLSVKDSGIDKITLSPEARKDRIMEAFKQIVHKGSEIRPLILAYEDLHWADKSSEDLLKYGLENIAGARVLMIFTYRPEFVHTWGGRSYHNQINLNRLSNQESLAMVSYLLSTEDVDSDLEELILEKTEGVPFYIEEFIKSLKDLQIIERRANGYRIAKDIQTMTIPATIHDVIMARVDSLPEAAKVGLQTGSVIGREFGYQLIMRVMGLSEQEMMSNLSVLKDSELLYERGIYPQSSYIFKHALTQEVAYNSLLLKKRKAVHEEAGRAIEQIYQERLEEFYEIMAFHYSLSENSEKAYQYLELSGEKAMRNYSNWEAFRFYKKAITVLNLLPETEERNRKQIEIHLLVSIPIARLGYPEDSLEILQDGERLAKELGDKKGLGTFYSRLCHYYSIKGGDPLLGTKYGEKCFKEAEKIQNIELMAPMACDLCAAYIISGEFLKLVDMVPKVLAFLEKTQRKSDFFGSRFNVYTALCEYCGYALGMLGDFEKGKAICEKGLPYSLEANDLYGLGWSKFVYGSLFFNIRDGENTIDQLQESIKYLEKGQGVLLLGWAWTTLGAGYFFLGDLETALKYIEKGLKIHNDQGMSFYRSFHYRILSEVYFDSGDLKNAQGSIEEALKLSQKNKEKHIEGMSWELLGRILGKTNISQRLKAEEYILKGIKILEELGVKPWASQGYLFLGELYADAGQKEKAMEHFKKAEERFQEMGMHYWLVRTQEFLQSCKV
jgi:class 3 adenylate cyclase/tetratricopeptide (TPR) repeat protein